jgi:hypothetical protein
MSHPAWALIAVGSLLAITGLVWLFVPSIPWLGKLPGDIVIERERYTLYFPVVTCLVLSLALSAVYWLVRQWPR